jgi:glycosyl transferase, family 25
MMVRQSVMKAYCINLDRRPERLAHMTAEFAKAGIVFERISAVDGQDPAVAAAAASLPVSHVGVPITPGVHGCFESHREFWRRVVASGDKWGMVFEDDVLLAPAINLYLQDNWIPADADIVKLETSTQLVHVFRRRLKAPGGRYLSQLNSTHWGTGCYIISATTAQRLLREVQGVGEAVDSVLFSTDLDTFATLRVYQMVPAPVVQGQLSENRVAAAWSESSLSERYVGRFDPVERVKDPLILRLRKIFRIRQRLLGLRQGTRYEAIPHG